MDARTCGAPSKKRLNSLAYWRVLFRMVQLRLLLLRWSRRVLSLAISLVTACWRAMQPGVCRCWVCRVVTDSTLVSRFPTHHRSGRVLVHTCISMKTTAFRVRDFVSAFPWSSARSSTRKLRRTLFCWSPLRVSACNCDKSARRTPMKRLTRLTCNWLTTVPVLCCGPRMARNSVFWKSITNSFAGRWRIATATTWLTRSII